MRDIEVTVQLSYPVTNMPGGKADETGRYVELAVEDGASGEALVRVSLSANELMRIMSGEITRVSDGALTSSNLDRVGKRLEVETQTFSHGALREDIDAAIADARAEGWEEVTEVRSNRGPVVRCRRWIEE